MFVSVIHRIHDPEGFKETEAKALEAGLPPSVALPVHTATPDHRLGICIWEGESVAAVREVVEGAVGPYAKNEYAEMKSTVSRRNFGISLLALGFELKLLRTRDA